MSLWSTIEETHASVFLGHETLDWLFRRVVWLPQSGGGGTAVMVGDGGGGITGLICFQKKVVNRGRGRSIADGEGDNVR